MQLYNSVLNNILQLQHCRSPANNLQKLSLNLMTLFSFVCECFQAEQLVDQQVLISRLRSDLMTFRGNTSQAPVETGASGYSSKRPRSVPLIRDSSAHGPPRRVGSSTVLFCVCLRVYNWLCVYLLYQLHINHWLLLVLTFCLPLTHSWPCIFLCECMCVCRSTPVPQLIH